MYAYIGVVWVLGVNLYIYGIHGVSVNGKRLSPEAKSGRILLRRVRPPLPSFQIVPGWKPEPTAE